jgi:hypothetical protein
VERSRKRSTQWNGPPQINEITGQAHTRGITVTILVDFVHVMGYLHQAARALHDPGDPGDPGATWATDLGRIVLTGRAVDAIATIRHRIATVKPGPTHQAEAQETITYLTNKRPYLAYPAALASGWPIATGLIEGVTDLEILVRRNRVTDRDVALIEAEAHQAPPRCLEGRG